MTATTPGDPAVARPAFAAEVQPLILIVDHDRDAIAQLRRVTARQGFRSLAVDDGEDALEVAATNFPHLIILEWALPSLSGIGLCRRLRAQGATRDVPIMTVTGRTGEADKVQGLDAGADDYVTKPFSAEEVGARMRALIRRADPVAGAGILRFGELSLDLRRRQVK